MQKWQKRRRRGLVNQVRSTTRSAENVESSGRIVPTPFYFKETTKPAMMRNPSQYSIIKAVVLKSKETWSVFEKLPQKYSDAEIPNSEVKKAISSLQEIRKEETPRRFGRK